MERYRLSQEQIKTIKEMRARGKSLAEVVTKLRKDVPHIHNSTVYYHWMSEDKRARASSYYKELRKTHDKKNSTRKSRKTRTTNAKL